MPLRDLLWACPECATPGSIGSDGRCACGVLYRRGHGARIVATYPDGTTSERHASTWVDSLPDPASLPPHAPGVLRRSDAVIREVVGHAAVHARRRFLNRIETYGPGRHGVLELRPDVLAYGITGYEGAGRRWPIDRLTAVQTSSSSLQIKARLEPLVSFRFPDDSIFLWETLLHESLRRFYRRSGRGEIVEFQPRIVTR